MFFVLCSAVSDRYNFHSQISVRVSAPSYRFVLVVNTETSDISHGAVSSATP